MEVLQKCGISISPTVHVVSGNGFDFVLKLTDELSRNDELTDKFIEEFADLCFEDDGNKFVQWLTAAENENNPSVKNESLITLLLECRLVQYRVIEVLLEKLVSESMQLTGPSNSETALNRETWNPSQRLTTSSQIIRSSSTVNEFNRRTLILQLIVNHLKWINQVYPPLDASSPPIVIKLLDTCLSLGLCLDLKQMLIDCVPNLTSNDQEHDVIAEKLLQISAKDPRMHRCVLDEISSLSGLSVVMLLNVREDVCESLKSCDMEDVPILIRFCVRSAAVSDDIREVVETIQTLRSNFDLLSFSKEIQNLSQMPNGPGSVSDRRREVSLQKAKKDSIFKLLLEVLHMEIIQKPILSKAWLTVLEEKNCHVQSLDLVILIIIHHLQISKKKVIALLKMHVKSCKLKVEIATKTLADMKENLKEYSQTLLDFSAAVSRHDTCSASSSYGSPVSKSAKDKNGNFYVEFGTALFFNCDMFTRQELVVQTVTNICVAPDCANNAFMLLQRLVDENVDPLRKYSSFIYGVFDHMHLLNLDRVRKLFSILTRLVLQQIHSDSLLNDEMYIIIKKQLASRNERFEKVGVTAAFAAITETLRIMSKSNDKTYMKKMLEEIKQILELVEKFVSTSYVTLSLFFEEFALLIVNTNAMNYKLIFERIRSLSQKYWLMFFEDGSQGHQSGSSSLSLEIPVEKRFGMSQDNAICLNLSELTNSSLSTPGKPISSLIDVLPSFLTFYWHYDLKKNALRSSRGTQQDPKTQNTNNSFSNNLKNVLQCSFKFPSEQICSEVLDSPGSISCRSLEFLCSCHLGLINYIRELLNLLTTTSTKFAFTDDREWFDALSSRVTLLNSLQETFLKLLKVTPTYQFATTANPFSLPETLSFGAKKIIQLPHQVPLLVPSKKPTARRGKAKKNNKKQSPQDAQEDDGDDANTESSARSVQAESQNQEACMFTAPGSSANFDSDRFQNVLDAIPRKDYSLDSYLAFIRELNLDVFSILKPQNYQLEAIDNLSGDLDHLETPKTSMTPNDLLIALRELNSKLKLKLLGRSEISTALKEKHLGVNIQGFYKLLSMDTLEVVSFCKDLFPSLVDFVTKIAYRFSAVIEENDGIQDCADMLTPVNLKLSQCLELLLQSISTIVNWKGFKFHESTNQDITLNGLLRTIRDVLDLPSLVEPSVEDLLDALNGHLIKISDSITQKSCAVRLTSLCFLLSKISDEECQLKSATAAGSKSDMNGLIMIEKYEPVSELAESFLRRSWNAPNVRLTGAQNEDLSSLQLKGSANNLATSQLVHVFIFGNTNPFRCIEKTLKNVAKCVLSDLNESAIQPTCAVSLFPAVTSETFPAFFNSAWNLFIYFTKKIPLITKKNGGGSDPASRTRRNYCMQEWFKSVKTLYTCLKISKIANSRVMFLSIVRGGAVFVEQFIKKAIPLLETTFREHTVDVKAMMKNVRDCSQDLQVICTHSKVTNDIGLMRNVPKLRKNLESLLYKIKAVFAYHGCVDQFSLIPLKNRDINGDEIFSQRELENDESVVSEDVQLSDDDDDEVENDESLQANIQSSQVLRQRDETRDGDDAAEESYDDASSSASHEESRPKYRRVALSEDDDDDDDSRDRIAQRTRRSNDGITSASNRRPETRGVQLSEDEEAGNSDSDCHSEMSF